MLIKVKFILIIIIDKKIDYINDELLFSYDLLICISVVKSSITVLFPFVLLIQEI